MGIGVVPIILDFKKDIFFSLFKVTPQSAVTPVKAADPAVIGGSRAESRVKMNRMRLRIASRLKVIS